MATEYDLLADRAAIVHRPKDQAGLRIAAIDLAASGLTPGDIAQALGLSLAAVEQLLQGDPK